MQNAIPFVSDSATSRIYDAGMAETLKKSKAPAWALVIEEHVRTTGGDWTEIAGALDMTEGGIRHWRNGTREISLKDFVALCRAAKAEPAAILQIATHGEQPGAQSLLQHYADSIPEWQSYILGLALIGREQQALILKTMGHSAVDAEQAPRYPVGTTFVIPKINKSQVSGNKNFHRTKSKKPT